MTTLHQAYQHMPEPTKLALDAVSVLAWISALTGVLTSVVGLLAALASLVWGCLRIYEMPSFQRWLAKRRAKKSQ